jgi:hypothetical protein
MLGLIQHWYYNKYFACIEDPEQMMTVKLYHPRIIDNLQKNHEYDNLRQLILDW